STAWIGSRQLSPPVTAVGSNATDGCAAAIVRTTPVAASTTAASSMWWMMPAPWRSPATGTKPRLRRSRSVACTSRRPPRPAWITTESARLWSGWPRTSRCMAGPLCGVRPGEGKRCWTGAAPDGYGGRMQITDSVSLVTGGASGLGEATVRTLAGAGGRVVVLDRPGSAGDAVARSLGDRAVFAPADVTSEAEVAAAVARAVERFGALHVVVNCAGVGAAMRTITKEGPMPLEIFRKVIEINLIGTLNVIRLAAAAMAKNGPNAEGERGVVVNTASAAAFDGQIGQAAYSASKGGVVALTLPVARD